MIIKSNPDTFPKPRRGDIFDPNLMGGLYTVHNLLFWPEVCIINY